jgi:hypothetical protein
MTSRRGHALLGTTLGLFLAASSTSAHSGPPFPILSNQIAGPYRISIWTDPDSTDDGSAAGRFWVGIHQAQGDTAVPSGTHASITIAPSERPAQLISARAEPTANDETQRFAALVMDHEGRFRVHLAVDGPLGVGEADAEVDATYDLRPAPWLFAVYLLPFILVGFLWLKLLWRRRAGVKGQGGPGP